ncbi:acid-sensing ion channel 1C-like [Acanthaster planci]|uniref:Acid-sensing ion channel 1C-like n=1 Tax=Acanthaster planci TaxID=133434 RepID=A0A8B7Y3A1_ACAPL|nr:acid-sensing ion channel 1C-like [Acanthaster planci]XP_022086796.1 acid-sensing ion channel 1C-like [Acanthaster planci]XP_022086797.1 acid-sensing ion channel 1C-like [Acanthaster planci]XP_022086798.1 acid-sensing ion channel 1C-like [Acanthaster planci]XP_022086800.1 acid-sensing ion channel 1C-like [Acanthaster planci]
MTASAPDTETNLEEEFVSNTTLHGIARVAHNSRTIFRLAWLAIMLVFLGVCIAQITDRLQRFFMYKANTAISVEYVGDLDFPAVTICNFNRYRWSELTSSDLRSLNYILEATDYDYDSYGEASSSSLSDTYPLDDDNASSAFNYTEFTLRAGFLMDDLTLLSCEWRGKTNSCSAANFSHVFTSFGNCWTFNSGSDGGPLLKEIQAGAGNGLRVQIDIQQNEYTEPLSGNREAGLKVLVHDQQTPPMMDSQGFAIQPGVHAFVATRRQQFLNLEPPYGKCDASRTLNRFPNYTLEGCNIECRTEKIIERCNCRLVRHPGTEVECTPRQTSECARDVLSKLRSGEIPACDCPVPCNYTTFSTSLSTATLPNQRATQLLVDQYDDLAQYSSNISDTTNTGSASSAGQSNPILLDSTYMQNNWILLDVFYENINFQRYEQSEAITPSALISDIGGQLGLFLGASFITLTEILSYLGRKLGSILASRRPRRAATSPDTSPGWDMNGVKIT